MKTYAIGYAVVLLLTAVVGRAAAAPPPVRESVVDLGGGVYLEMILIPVGDFMMGAPEADRDAAEWEKPQHHVRITKPFYLGKHLVTQEQWQVVMGKNPSHFKNPKNPVEMVSWDDCQAFLAKLNLRQGNRSGKFQLPTEAQWEYACRAGSTTRYSFGDDESALGEYAWFGRNAGMKTHPVGEKRPNAWGLYDMHGNVFQWCQDWYDKEFYAKSATYDPTGPDAGAERVSRGGSWYNPARRCRSAGRCHDVSAGKDAVLGLRVAW